MTLDLRRKLIAFVTFVAGLYFFLEFILPETMAFNWWIFDANGKLVWSPMTFKFGLYHDQILRGVQVVGVMAFGLGLINILRVHGGRLAYVQKGWPNSLALILGLIVMFVVQGGEFLASQRSAAQLKPLADLQIYVTKINTDMQLTPAPAANAVLLVLESLNRHGEPFVELGRALADEGNQKAKSAVESFQLELNMAKERAESLRSIFAQRAQTGDLTEESIAGSSEAGAALLSQIKRLVPPARDLSSTAFELTSIRKWSKLFFEGFFVPLGAAMFSLLAFYIAKAAFRSFRVRSVEATVMMLTAVVVILGQTPFGVYISQTFPENIPPLSSVRLWLLQNVNTPGNRAIYFGAAVGGFAMAIRMWLSLEKSALDSDEGAS